MDALDTLICERVAALKAARLTARDGVLNQRNIDLRLKRYGVTRKRWLDEWKNACEEDDGAELVEQTRLYATESAEKLVVLLDKAIVSAETGVFPKEEFDLDTLCK